RYSKIIAPAARERGTMHQEQQRLGRLPGGGGLALAVEIEPDLAFNGPVLFYLDIRLLGSGAPLSKTGPSCTCGERSSGFDEITPVHVYLPSRGWMMIAWQSPRGVVRNAAALSFPASSFEPVGDIRGLRRQRMSRRCRPTLGSELLLSQ